MLNTTGDIYKQFRDLNKNALLTKLNNLKQILSNKEAKSFLVYPNDVTMKEKLLRSEKGKIEHKENMMKYRKEQI